MCLITGILETPLVTREWYWIQYACGTHLKVASHEVSFRQRGGQEHPCPIHQPTEWSAKGNDGRVDKFGDRHHVDIVIGN